MLYFAYGSNLDWAQMRKRCPSAQHVAVAKLPGHQLAFTRYSKGRDCGVADAVPKEQTEIWGAVFSISEVDVGQLDKSEGFRPDRPSAENSYVRREIHVWRDGDQDSPLLVSAYFGIQQPTPPLPNTAYKRLIVEGAKFWHLPEDYLARLEEIEVSQT